MPGLNQLKKFSEDIKNIGDETKIRAQRGEKTSSVPLPEGIPEKDDSEDFIIGMPEVKKGEDAAAQEQEKASEKNENEPSSDMPNLDSILSPQGENGDDAPDLSEFLDNLDSSPLDNSNGNSSETTENVGNSGNLDDSQNAAEETPLEDLDLDSLLNSLSDDIGNPDEKPDEAENIGDYDKTNVEDAEVIKETPADSNDSSAADSVSVDSTPASADSNESGLNENQNQNDENDENEDNRISDVLPDTKETNPDAEFAYDGSAINLNDDLPDDILQKDGVGAQDEKTPENADAASNANAAPKADDNMDLFSNGLDDLDFGGSSASINSNTASSSVSDDLNGSEIPDSSLDVPGEDSSASNPNSSDSSSDSAENDVPIEQFDTSEMEGMDFTPESPKISENEFPVTGENQNQNDDFVLDDSFTIPGFSDTETADLSKKTPKVDTVDFSGKAAKPKNTLTEEEYEQFKRNLSDYPLNLRLAIEDFIAKNEFTDDAVFEIIEKVLKKTPARQIATQLEKMLDITINVPRDYEKRSYEQYEAYKQSFQYTLKNRIIPAAIVGVILCFVCFGLFKAAQRFIYEPVMATINYKQGYALLQDNDFPQSEDKFSVAVSHKPIKKWFFRFADGYREKKQYERASHIYVNGLNIFNHDLELGKQYAEMELYDRANYEEAEKIVRREILDYHINNPDGLLLLGDVFLEWAQVDDSKYEQAKNQYLELIQRYGENNLYLSRMLRYYIRTDKLREVLNLKNIFYPNIKSLSSDDWTELSGYLLDKLYGKLSKNDEYLRGSIEDVRSMLDYAITTNPKNPVAHYNLARYLVNTGYSEQAKTELENTLNLFDDAKIRSKKNVYREINASRILGELYSDNKEYLKAQEVFTRGADLYNDEHDSTGFEGDENTGKLFADLGDIDYFVSGELDSALYNYKKSAEIKNDTPSVNYRIGAIYYGKEDYDNALASFLKVQEKEPKDSNVLLALGNTLVLRDDNFAAQSYYKDLLSKLNNERTRHKILLPQEDEDDGAIVDLYLKASNNLGVALYRVAKQTGNSQMNAEAMVKFADSMKAWDAMTRNPQTMVRAGGSNLGEQNSKYVTHSYPEFEPAIYTDIPKVLEDEKSLE